MEFSLRFLFGKAFFGCFKIHFKLSEYRARILKKGEILVHVLCDRTDPVEQVQLRRALALDLNLVPDVTDQNANFMDFSIRALDLLVNKFKRPFILPAWIEHDLLWEQCRKAGKI